jgi:hypothetical protein
VLCALVFGPLQTTPAPEGSHTIIDHINGLETSSQGDSSGLASREFAACGFLLRQGQPRHHTTSNSTSKSGWLDGSLEYVWRRGLWSCLSARRAMTMQTLVLCGVNSCSYACVNDVVEQTMFKSVVLWRLISSLIPQTFVSCCLYSCEYASVRFVLVRGVV